MAKMTKEKQQPPPTSRGPSLSTKFLAKTETLGTKQKEKQPHPSSNGPLLAKSGTIGTKQKEKQPHPSSLGPLLAKSETIGTKQKEKQPPASSLGPSLSTKPLSKSKTKGTKQEEQPPPPPPLPDSPSASSSNGEESPAPSYSLERLAGASTAVVPPKHSVPSSDSTDGEVEEEDESSESDHESKEEESQMEKKKPPPLLLPHSSNTNKAHDKQPPPSFSGPSLTTKSLAKSETTGTKQKEKQPPPLPVSPSASSSKGEESPSPNYPLEKAVGSSTAAVLPKNSEPSLDSTDSDVEEEDKSSESDHESMEEESSDDSAAVEAKPNPPPQLQASLEGKGQQISRSTSCSGSSSEDGDDDNEDVGSSSESDQPAPTHKQAENIVMKSEVPVAENESDSSSDSEHAIPFLRSSIRTAVPLSSKPMDCPAQPPDNSGIIANASSISGSKKKRKRDQQAPLHKQAENIVMKSEVPVAENESDSTSDSEHAIPFRRSSIRTAVPLSSKPMDCPAQPPDNSGIIANPSSISGSKKKRKRANEIREEAGPEKKSPFKRIWSTEDELGLLRGVLDYKERHNVVPSNLVQLEPLYDSIKGLISIPVTSNQMFEKVGRIRRNYIKRAKKLKESLWTRSLNGHSAAVFNIAAKIWGEKIRGDIKNAKEKLKHVGENEKHARYPSLHRFIKYEHTYRPWALRLSQISNAKSNKLEKKCEKLEITEVQLHVKKQELFSAAMELIDGALTKCE